MREPWIDYAVQYAAIGWPVLILHEVKSGVCSCGKLDCKSPGKHPRTKNGLGDATTNLKILNEWARKYPESNIGVVTGKPSGVFVLDVDPRHGGDDSLEKMKLELGAIPNEVVQVTGGSGTHICFRYSGDECRSGTNFYPGVDLRGDRGYIVVEPSNHVSGGHYFWDGDSPLDGATLPEMPKRLLEKLREKKRTASASAKPVDTKPLPESEVKKIRAALGFVSNVDDRDRWYKVGMALHATGAGDQAFGLWCEWSSQSEKFDFKDSRKVWDSFKPGGGTGLGTLYEFAKEGGYFPPGPPGPPEPPMSVYVENFNSQSEGAFNDSFKKTPPLNFPVPSLPSADARDGTANTRPLSELGNALRIIDSHVGHIYWVPEAKAFLWWDSSGAWRWDLDGSMMRGITATLPEKIYAEGSTNLASSEHFAKWSRNSQKHRTIESCVSIFKDFESARLNLSIIDKNPLLVGLDSGRQVLDLLTGKCRKSTQGDFITKSLAVGTLGLSDKAVRWNSFLKQVFGDDAELIDWVKRWLGYLLTGSTDDQIFVFCYGLGANGKSVLADIISFILCDYSRSIAVESITESRRQAGGATPDLADLIGARLAISSETEDGAALAESLIKSLVSGDVMTVRPLYGNPIQFKPQFKLMMLGNHKPIIRGNDYGIWRRVRLIPFKRIFKPEERDQNLLNKLKSEAPHILAWMVEGCLEWGRRGLGDVPETIKQATGRYQEEQDLFGNWLAECCLIKPLAEVCSTSLYANYKTWSLNNGLKPASNIALGRRLSERGFGFRQTNGKRFYSGICLADND